MRTKPSSPSSDTGTTIGRGSMSTTAQYRVEWFINGVLNRRDFGGYTLAFQWWHEVLLFDEAATFERVEKLGF